MRVLAAQFFVLALSPGAAQAGPDGAIELYRYGIDPETGNATVADFGSYQAPVEVVFHGFLGKVIIGVYARLGGASLSGIAGARFYLRGLETGPACQLPAGWTKSIVFPAGTIQAGNISNPHLRGQDTLRRLDTVWMAVTGPGSANCQKTFFVELGRVELQSDFGFATIFGGNHFVSVVGGNPPANSNFDCPVFFLCDAPFFTLVCVTGSQFIINPGGQSCTVAVESSTWSGVKNLYRD